MHLCRTRLNEGLKNNEDYLKSAMDQIQLLERSHSVTSSTRLLDFGCGLGPVGLWIDYRWRCAVPHRIY